MRNTARLLSASLLGTTLLLTACAVDRTTGERSLTGAAAGAAGGAAIGLISGDFFGNVATGAAAGAAGGFVYDQIQRRH